MGDIISYIEGRMDESELYARIAMNSFKALLLVIAALILGYVVYTFVIPSFASGKGAFYFIYVIISIIAFIYVFKPKTWIGRAVWAIYALAYATVMYLSGECVVIAIILMGLFVAVACVGGEVIFTSLFTYRDLKEWVKVDKNTRENIEKAKESSESIGMQFG